MRDPEREEQAMARDRYERLDDHKSAHRRLLEYIEYLKVEVDAGRAALDENMVDNLWDWVNAHIATEDHAYAKQIRWRFSKSEAESRMT